MSLTRAAALCVVAFLASSVHAADTYKVDPVHMSVIFRVQHLGVSYVYGRFNDKSGTIDIDESDPTKDSFDISIKTDSVDTGNPNRDKHLKSGDFFSAQEFPDIHFKSTSVKAAGDNLEVTGDLTLHGATKPLTVVINRTGTKDTQMGHRTGFECDFTVKRSDFGMNKMLDAVGDEVKLIISIEAVKRSRSASPLGERGILRDDNARTTRVHRPRFRLDARHPRRDRVGVEPDRCEFQDAQGCRTLALVLGFLIAFPFIKSGHWEWPQIPPPPSTGAKGWLPAIAIIALIAGWIDALVRLSGWMRASVTAIASALALALLLKFKFASSWTPAEGIIAIALLSISAAIWCQAAQDVIVELPATSLVILWLIASCIAVVLLLIATLDYGQLCITLAAGVFSLLPAIVWRRSDNPLRGLAVVFAILITSLLAGAFYTSELGLMQLLILGSAPIFLWLSRWLPIRSKTWQRAALRIAVTLIPLATAVGLAVNRFHNEQQQEQQEQEL